MRVRLRVVVEGGRRRLERHVERACVLGERGKRIARRGERFGLGRVDERHMRGELAVQRIGRGAKRVDLGGGATFEEGGQDDGVVHRLTNVYFFCQ